ncbi:MAG: terminase [Ignavibacteria bacterium]|nr:terminase [Ignavibacteria bacterium]
MAKKAIPPKKKGRPSKLLDIDLGQVTTLAAFNLTNVQIATVLGVTEQAINRYKEDEAFSLALKKGKEISDNRVVKSLFERAMGYDHPHEEIFCNKDGVVTRVQTIKHYPPSEVACIFWLKNRKSAEWRDKQEIEIVKPLIKFEE